MTPSVFPQRYSMFRRQKRYLVEFRRNDQQVTHLWDPRKPFALGAPARFYLQKENSRIHLIDRKDGGWGVEVATVKFNHPLSVKLHPGDRAPWVITLRVPRPFEPVAFRSPETLEVSDIAPPFFLYSGLRRQLLSQTQVGEHFKIHISSTSVYGYEYLRGQHTIIPLQEEVTWRNFDGECQELINGVPFSLDNLAFLEGWVEWNEHWWRTVPIESSENTERLVVRHQDPSFFVRYTTIAISLVAWFIWLLIPMKVTEVGVPSPAASVTIQSPKTFIFPRSSEHPGRGENVDRERLKTDIPEKRFVKKRGRIGPSSDEVTVKITTAPLQKYEEEGTTVVGTTAGDQESSPSEEVWDSPVSRRGFNFGQNLDIRGNGAVSKMGITKTLQRKADSFRECYLTLARKEPEAKGTLVLNWTITRTGKTQNVKIVRSDIADSGFMDCLKTQIQSMDFPRPKNDSIEIEMPFVIESMGH